jgi:curved DNA-binding protein CbpA
MIDYFALLDQPRGPWLDLDELKNVYHARARQTHPDLNKDNVGVAADTSFTNLNEAYQVLQDPKRRLHHLLSLEGVPPDSGQVIPQDLQDLFPKVGHLSQRAKVLLEERKATSNKLSQSLLKPRVVKLQTETNEMRLSIQSQLGNAVAKLQEMNASWSANSAAQIGALSNLYIVFAYLSRWSGQLDEIAFQLSLD